ncbi:MAG: hypothetical protein M0R39_09230 [Prolixibacteraceae bacterium]|nr:hypothetical protein [Prolixibacteraceae bacterium]
MAITIRKVENKKDLRLFIHLPAEIHKDHPNWVPPLYMDEWEYFNPKKNLLFAHCEHILLLAIKEGKCVGRCMGLISKDYNKSHNENHVRFSNLETYNDPEVFNALVNHVADWGKSFGMDKMVGPLAFSDKDPQGFLIEGYDKPVVIASNCNFPYMVDLTEAAGFTKKVDCVVYQIPIPDEIPPLHQKILERAEKQNTNLKLLQFTSRRKIKPLIRPALRLVNKTFTDIYGFLPFNEKEMDDFANKYLFLINPRFVKLIANEENEIIALFIAMDDISEGIKKSKGYLFPFGIFQIFAAARKTKQINLLLGAIDPRYQGRGLDVWMGLSLVKSARDAGKVVMDSHLELEYNTKVRAEMEKFGGKVYKKFRIFQREV